ncbi:hypothetical protein H6F47_01135 [Sphaerospermopsis sp. FACHB-1094]|nr:hypothetical protein [Sphaerospermopsis sp. FACHB-1094]
MFNCCTWATNATSPVLISSNLDLPFQWRLVGKLIIDRAEDFNPEAGSKPGFATLIGVLTAEVSIKNIKGFLSFLSDRLGDKPIEITVKVGDKEVSIKAKSRQELLESEKIAKDLLAAMGGNNG